MSSTPLPPLPVMVTEAASAPPASGADASSSLPADRVYWLQRTQVLAEVQADLVAWGKTRFWGITIIVVTLGYIGIGALVRDVARQEFRDAMKASAAAEAAAENAKTVTELAKSQTDGYRRTVESLQRQATGLEDSFERLGAQAKASAENVQEGARLSDTTLESRIRSLEGTVTELIKKTRSAEAASQFAQRQQTITAQGVQSVGRFESNARYTIEVSWVGETTPPVKALLEQLKEAGFKTEEYSHTSAAEDEDSYNVAPGTLTKATSAVIMYSRGMEAKANEVADMLKRYRPTVAIVTKADGDPSSIGMFLP